MPILAFESSCDDSSVAIYKEKSHSIIQFSHSQIVSHLSHGGVVPEIASREHLTQLPKLLEKTMQSAEVEYGSIDAVAYTRGPGLVGSLLVGASFAQTIAYQLKKPLLPTHHVEAHMLICLYDNPELQFPFLCLIVSGGHTLLVYAKGLGDYQILGETLDDAAGEAFDKGGKCLGFDYPGGPEVARIAASGQPRQTLSLPRPLLNHSGYDFSFSGMKTAFASMVKTSENSVPVEDLCYALEQAIIKHLLDRVNKVINIYQGPVVLCGGVAMNQQLRIQLTALSNKYGRDCYFPSSEHCCDNAGMIAYTAYLYWQSGLWKQKKATDVRARWPIFEIN